MREKLIEILQEPIYLHELADPTVAVADYLLDNDVVPVVLCKDCDNTCPGSNGLVCTAWGARTDPDGWCYMAERKDNG